MCVHKVYEWKHTYLTLLHLFYPLKYGAWHITIINVVCVRLYTECVHFVYHISSSSSSSLSYLYKWTEYFSRLVSLDPLAYVVQISCLFYHPKIISLLVVCRHHFQYNHWKYAKQYLYIKILILYTRRCRSCRCVYERELDKITVCGKSFYFQ